MPTLGMVLIGLVGGFVLGIVVSEIIGVVGFGMSGGAVGVKFLPVYLAIAGGIIVPFGDNAGRRRRR